MPAFASSAAMIAFVPPLADTLISFASGTPASASCVPYPLAGAGTVLKGTSRSRRAGISDVEAVAGEERPAAPLLQDDGDVAGAPPEPHSPAPREPPPLAPPAPQRGTARAP